VLESPANAKYILAMSSEIKSLLSNIGAIGIVAGAILLFTHPSWNGNETPTNNYEVKKQTPVEIATSTVTTKTSATTTVYSTSTSAKEIARPSAKTTAIEKLIPPVPSPAPATSTTKTSDTFTVTRVQDPYHSPPQSFDDINNKIRPALVNILCTARSGTFKPISASGVIIDPRGVILTNAHVAQYILLSSDPIIDLSCVIRSGSPAYPTWNAEVLFIPPSWIEAHAADIKKSRPVGTGEYDYALLRITGRIDGQPLASLPFVPVDTRETIGFTDDYVLVASYPAEFIGGISTQLNLYPASSVTDIKKMLTFDNKTVDVLSLGGIIEAQSGSSGGAVVNEWGRLVGIISTTSDGRTTSDRDLHAIALSYVNRNITSESGLDLQSILDDDVAYEASVFNTTVAPSLRQLLVDQLKVR
jgi:hypothetical protein